MFKIRTPTEKPSCMTPKQQLWRLREPEVKTEYQNFTLFHSVEDVTQNCVKMHEKTLKIVYSPGWMFLLKQRVLE